MSESFVFERGDEKSIGKMVFCDFPFTAAYFDSLTGTLYVASGVAGEIFQWDDLTQLPYTIEWKSKVIVTKEFINLGAARVIADYVEGSPITFKLWADKELIFTTELTDGKMFRLPTGYRSDTFEFSVEGKLRVRAVHLAETPSELRTA